MRQHRTHFRRRQHHGKARRSFRALKTVQPPQLLIQHFLIKEQNGAQGLILRRRRHIPLRRKVGQESVHLLHPHLRGVLLAVKKNKPFDPINIRLFRAYAVMLDPDFLPHLLQQLWLDSVLHGSAPSSKSVGAIRAPAHLTSNDLQKHEWIRHQIWRFFLFFFWCFFCVWFFLFLFFFVVL